MDGELSIQIEPASLTDVTQGVPREQISKEPISLTVPFEIKCRGREVRLVITGTPSEAEPISSLIRAVAMASGWAERIASGEIVELKQLTREYGIERSYAQKVLRCVALSPRHVEAILSGQHSPELTFALATANIPLQWELQRLGSPV